MPKKILPLIIFILIVASFQKAEARENVNYWYIKKFDTKIIVNTNSTIEITEKITADCGNAPEKHGIFRVLPKEIRLTSGESIEMPIKLLSITDFNDKKIPYSTITDYDNKTITWKIGDSSKTVTGVNTYKIHYLIKNVINFENINFDELYWNLNGNFWDIETDNFNAEIIFPSQINKHNSKVTYYTGQFGSKNKNLANFTWKNNVLNFNSIMTLRRNEGITASITFPKNIISPYAPTFWEKYGKYLFLSIPILVFITCLSLWKKYGKDSKLNKPVIAEYEVPENLPPLEIGALMHNGRIKKEFITAEIIYLASRGLLTIKEYTDKVLFFNSKGYKFIKNDNVTLANDLSKPQQIIYNKIFEKANEVKLSSLKETFHITVTSAKEKTLDNLNNKNLLTRSGGYFRTAFIIAGLMTFFFSFFSIFLSGYLTIGLLLSSIIIVVFGIIMPKRTLAGAELNHKIKGFKLFMKTVDKDRAKFYEKENIFEKLLPYAIVFGITELWIKRMKKLYGEEYFNNYVPAWYMGDNLKNLNSANFTSIMNSLSSSIASTTTTSSGSSESGSSGGGGGGGGGGGW